MKTKLLAFTLFFVNLSFSQTIATFESNPNTNFTILNPSTSIDQSATGSNAVWTFNNLTEVGANIDTYAAPSATETTTYPGTTEVLSITTQGSTPNINKFFLAEDGAGTSITGISQGDVILNYSNTNAFIGLFPMNFGTNNSTNIAGTFSYQGTSGTFSGTLTSNVEAYGTLNVQDYNESVTRLHLDQNLTFSVPFIDNVATLTQTIYYYFNTTTNNIDFRYSNTSIVSGFLGINDTSETLEFNTSENTLSNKNLNVTSDIKIHPNPARDFINIQTENNDSIKSLKVFDNKGRAVSIQKSQNKNLININTLQSGLYFLSIETDSGVLINQKIIKK